MILSNEKACYVLDKSIDSYSISCLFCAGLVIFLLKCVYKNNRDQCDRNKILRKSSVCCNKKHKSAAVRVRGGAPVAPPAPLGTAISTFIPSCLIF